MISEELPPVRWRLGEKVVREERLGLWMEELWLPSHLCRRLPKQVMRGRKVGEREMIKDFQLWLIRSKFRK